MIKIAKDPVCTMEVAERTAQYKSEYEGETYYFCSLSCKKAFDENPDAYVIGSIEENYAGK